jgi:hypothetical protein
MSLGNTKYFVLEPKGNTPWANASRSAMRVFASEISESDPKLSNNLKQWAYEEERRVSAEPVTSGEDVGDY